MTIDSTRALILDDEGSRIWPYDDATGQPPPCIGNRTWGVGHNLDASPVSAGTQALLESAVRVQFTADLSRADAALRLYPWYPKLNAPRLGALTDAMFNLGAVGFGQFTRMLGRLAHEDWAGASIALLDSQAAVELPKRYGRLARMLRTGEWPE